MATPEFVLELRAKVGTAELWMPGVTAVVLRHLPDSTGARRPVDWDAQLDPATVEVLLVQRADNGHWTPVTGIIDPREEPAVAGARETREEAGVEARAVRLLSTEAIGPLQYPNGDRASYLDIAFAYEWVGGEPHPADGENTRAEFVRADQLPALNARFTRVIARALTGRAAADFAS
ncbi:MAG: NUDIX domain-containing protein [Buchananella hordeovulneris]|nr:NUDIX domain-containing protein [Buchananella hordeovulneris]